MRGRPRSQRRAFWGGVRWLTFGAAASGAILIKNAFQGGEIASQRGPIFSHCRHEVAVLQPCCNPGFPCYNPCCDRAVT